MRVQVWRDGDIWRAQAPAIPGSEVSAMARDDIPKVIAAAVRKMVGKNVDPALVEMQDVAAPS